MAKFVKNIVIITVLSILGLGKLYAQQKWVTLSGSFTEKKNYEVIIVGMDGNRSFRLAQYFVDTTDNRFLLTVPMISGVDCSLQVVVMKEGHRRLEVDHRVSFPLQLDGQDLELTLDPSLFQQDQKGLTVKPQVKKHQVASVSGIARGLKSGLELSLDKVVDGQLQKVQIFRMQQNDSTFNFQLLVEKEGFYYISTLRSRKRIYLKPQDKINLTLDVATGTTIGTSKSTEENEMIVQWEKIMLPLTMIAMEYKPDRELFFKLYTSKQLEINAFIEKVKTSNSQFNALFKMASQVDNNRLALEVLWKSSVRKVASTFIQAKEFLDVPNDYRELVYKNKEESSGILLLGEGYEYINLLAKLNLLKVEETTRRQWGDAERVVFMMESITNDDLKSVLLKAQLDELEFNVSNYSEFRDIFMPYAQYVKDGTIRKKYDGLYRMFAADTAFIGKSAYDFTLPDGKGRMFSMKDFKGKVIFIDVWATWCGPCKVQMPFLKEIEEHYHGNEHIVFVGISLDAEKDKDKWLNMIKEKELGGVQLLDSKGESFARKYNIAAIPRFCLIDKNGNWSEVRCPLPESKEKLIRYIDKELMRLN
ncbi:TlpA family protein disulfide reductase [Sphingobacterium lumbrici]|uniref:TlpA family protein disulfide reductase n=1 Tax=Sphingobacterium lumbrici TaxID=2559600 RepID=UPI001127C6CB|nr:TlpA disulfide reductase family protein [Sphingobacterium lumbrici]